MGRIKDKKGKERAAGAHRHDLFIKAKLSGQRKRIHPVCSGSVCGLVSPLIYGLPTVDRHGQVSGDHNGVCSVVDEQCTLVKAYQCSPPGRLYLSARPQRDPSGHYKAGHQQESNKRVRSHTSINQKCPFSFTALRITQVQGCFHAKLLNYPYWICTGRKQDAVNKGKVMQVSVTERGKTG